MVRPGRCRPVEGEIQVEVRIRRAVERERHARWVRAKRVRVGAHLTGVETASEPTTAATGRPDDVVRRLQVEVIERGLTVEVREPVGFVVRAVDVGVVLVVVVRALVVLVAGDPHRRDGVVVRRVVVDDLRHVVFRAGRVAVPVLVSDRRAVHDAVADLVDRRPDRPVLLVVTGLVVAEPLVRGVGRQ